jgi:hypothetical protein
VPEPVKGSLFKRMRTVKRTSTRAAMETRFAARAVMGLRDASLPAEVEAIVAYVHGAGGVLPASSSPAVDVVRAVSAVEGTLLPASEPATLEWLRRVVALPASSESARAVHAYAQQQLSAAAGAIEGMDAWHDRTEADHDHADETAAGRAPKSLLDFARIVLAERGSRLP